MFKKKYGVSFRDYLNNIRLEQAAMLLISTSDKVYTVARVCCFRDDSVPYSWNKLALRKGNYNWRDELGLRWLSPAQKDAQDYIAALCGELGDLGVDEIVLEQWHFPIEGNVENITQGEKYDPNRFTASLEEFLTKLGGATGAKISLRVSRNTLSGAESVSGVTPELLERYSAEDAEPMRVDRKEIELLGAEVVYRPLMDMDCGYARHSGIKVAQAVLELYQQRADTKIF